MYYLEEFEISDKDREDLSESFMSFGRDSPLKVRLSIISNELQLIERK
jgi:hypothetical protein